MAGGNWETQNKVRPGAYVNFETNSLVATGVDATGPVVIPMALDWGETGTFIEVSPNDRFNEKFGKTLNELIPIREAFKATGKVILYNLSGSAGDKATATSGAFTATAQHVGTDGDNIIVSVTNGLSGKSTVRTHYKGAVVDSQVVSTVEALLPNAYVAFSGSLPVADATINLTGGVTAAATNDSYADFAAGLDTQDFKVVAIGTDDTSIKQLLALKMKQWREEQGKNVTLVTNEYNAADHEGVVSVLNGVTVDTGFLSAKEALYWYAAAYANSITNSLTYAEYPGAIDAERLSHDEIVQALQDGHIVYTVNNEDVVVEQDINTFRSFTIKKNQDFRKNKIVRQMDILSNNVQHIFSKYFIGKVDNHDNGRDAFKGQVMTVVLDPMARRGALEYREYDIKITQGAEKDAVVVTMGIKFNDAMEKLYMTVECK